MAQGLEMVHGSKTLHAGERGDETPGAMWSVYLLPTPVRTDLTIIPSPASRAATSAPIPRSNVSMPV